MKANQQSGERLETWKEIASFFNKDERTVKRWEKQRGLPVHRFPGTGRAGVYAYADELNRWLHNGAPPEESVREEQLSTAPPNTVDHGFAGRPWKFALIGLAMLALVGGAVALAGLSRAATKHDERTGHVPDAEARELYLRGRYFWEKRTQESLEKAVDHFTQAIVRDPQYAAAYAGLADCYNLLREYAAMPPGEAYPRAIAAARRAVALDDSLAEAHNSLAFAEYWWNWNEPLAGREFRRALELQPESAQAHHWYATLLLSTGRFQQSLRQINMAQNLEPGSTAVLSDKALILYYAGFPEQGIALLRQIEAVNPRFSSPHNYLAGIHFDRHENADYLAESGQAAALAHDADRTAIVEAGRNGLEHGGERGMLRAMLEARESLYAQGRGAAYEVARIYSRLGETSAALEFLRRSYTSHETNLLGMEGDEALAGLRADRTYKQLLTRVVNPQY